MHTPAAGVNFDAMSDLMTGLGRALKEVVDKLSALRPKNYKSLDHLPSTPMKGRLFQDNPNMEVTFSYKPMTEVVVHFRHAAGHELGARYIIGPDGREVRVSFVAVDPDGFRIVSNDLTAQSPIPRVDLEEPSADDGDNFISIKSILDKIPSIF